MSWSPCPDPVPGDRASTDAIETLIVPRAVDLGEMEVRRVHGKWLTVHLFRSDGPGRVPDRPGNSMCVPIHTSTWRLSPTCSRAGSCTATVWRPTDHRTGCGQLEHAA